MDNLAHSLLGLAASKAGFEKLSPGATAVCIVAANAPDIDFIAAISGDRWTVLHHHRGISHSLIGTLLLGLIIPVVFCLGDRVLAKARGRPSRLKFRGLLIASLIVIATHPLLDWTNSYGVRPLLPWSGRWFYGDLVFVIDPVLWLIFGGAAFLLTSQSKRQVTLWTLLATLLSLLVVYATVGGRGVDHPVLILTLWLASLGAIITCYKVDVGRSLAGKLAGLAFLILLGYWGCLSLLHSRALNSAKAVTAMLAAEKHEQVTRLAATPALANPIRWRCLAETDKAVYRFDVYLTDEKNGPKSLVRYEKPGPVEGQLINVAKTDRRTQFFFEFARFPVERIVGADCATQTLVQFADLRYTEPGQTRGSFSLEVPVECPASDVRNNGR